MFSMKQKQLALSLAIYALGLLMMVSISSCNGDEEEPIVIETNDFSVTIPENPTTGQSLGTISATTNRGTLSFAVEPSSTFDGAFNVNPSTGELTVGNTAYYDFETNTSVTGSVIITNGPVSTMVSVTITLTDVTEITVSASNFTLTMPENPATEKVNLRSLC